MALTQYPAVPLALSLRHLPNRLRGHMRVDDLFRCRIIR